MNLELSRMTSAIILSATPHMCTLSRACCVIVFADTHVYNDIVKLFLYLLMLQVKFNAIIVMSLVLCAWLYRSVPFSLLLAIHFLCSVVLLSRSMYRCIDNHGGLESVSTLVLGSYASLKSLNALEFGEKMIFEGP